MGRRRNLDPAPTGPRNWVLDRAFEIISQHEALTIGGWRRDIDTGRSARVRHGLLREEFNTRRAKAEIIAALVTIAVRGVPTSATVDWVVKQALRINGFRVRRGPAIVAGMIAGYEPLLDDSGRAVGLHRPAGSDDE